MNHIMNHMLISRPGKTVKFYLTIAFLLLYTGICYAGSKPAEFAEEEKEMAVEVPKTWLEKFFKAKQDFAEKSGTDVSVLFNYQQNVLLKSKEGDGKTKAPWYANLAISQKLWPKASLVFEAEGGRGNSVDKYVPTFSILDSNAGEYSLFYVPQLYLQQNALEDKFYFVLGRLDLSDWTDANAVASCADTQFQSSALVSNMAIPFPSKGIGAMAGVKPLEWAYFRYGVSNADARSTQVRLNGLFHSIFNISEIGFTPKIGERQGNYRFEAAYNYKRLDRIDGEGEQRHDWAFGLSFDQEVTDRTTLFFRYGFGDRRVRDIQNFWSAGWQVCAPFKKRKDDVFAAAVAQSIMGRDYLRNTEEAAKAETLFEIYYSLALNKFFTLTPNFQVVINPGADDKAESAIACGGRLVFIF